MCQNEPENGQSKVWKMLLIQERTTSYHVMPLWVDGEFDELRLERHHPGEENNTILLRPALGKAIQIGFPALILANIRS